MKNVAIALAALFCMTVLAVFALFVFLILNRNSARLDFDENLTRTAHVVPAAEQGIQLGDFDLATNGEEIYYFSEEPSPAIYVQNIETDANRLFLSLPGAFSGSTVSVLDDSEILVVNRQTFLLSEDSDGQENPMYILNTEGEILRTYRETIERASSCAAILEDPGAHTFFGYESLAIGNGLDMRVIPKIALDGEGVYVFVDTCADELLDEISEDLDEYRPVNQTNFSSMTVDGENNVLSYRNADNVILSNPSSTFTYANFECERKSNFVVKIGESGYHAPGTCVHSITRLSTSLRWSDRFIVTESDEIISLER